jgi:hypothetical protein
MIKTISLGFLILAFGGVLVYGGLLRTQEKTLTNDTSYPVRKNESNLQNKTENETPIQPGFTGQEQRNSGTPLNLAGAKNPDLIQLQGTIQSFDEHAILIQTISGDQIFLEGRALKFALEAGFIANVQDSLILNGFYEGEDFEITSITNQTNAQTIQIREENGRPLWSGGGRSTY